MTQPAPTPAPEVTPDPPAYPANPTPTQQLFINLDACIESIDSIAKNTSATDVWNTCTFGDWLLWLCFRQAPDMAERQRLAAGLAGMMSPYVVVANLPTPDTYTAVSGVLANLQSFAAGKMEGRALLLSARPLERIKPVNITSPGYLEFELAQAMFDLVCACVSSDQAAGAQWIMKFTTCIRYAMLRLRQAADMPSTQGVLAAAVRSSIVFKDFTAPSA